MVFPSPTRVKTIILIILFVVMTILYLCTIQLGHKLDICLEDTSVLCVKRVLVLETMDHKV